MTRTAEEAIAWGRAHLGKHGWDNLCLSFVRQSFGVNYVGNWPNSSRNAGTAWDRAKHKHVTSDPNSIPRGVPVFFEMATVADHVVLSLGGGRCLSNDFVVDGRIDEVSIAAIAGRWGRLLGWTEDLVGNRIYMPSQAIAEEAPVTGSITGRMPDATWVGEQSPRRPMSRYDIVCVHTIVGNAPAHAAHFSTRGDGEILQSRSTLFQSAANLNGNHRIIAIENEDHGSEFGKWTGSDVPPLTPAQVTACAKILAWAHKEHGVPLQLCPDSRPGSRGLAYHRQGIDGNFGPFKYPGRVPGGEVWTQHFGKVCPGDRRIAQLPDILAQAKALVSEEDDMQLTDPLWPDREDSPTVGDALRRAWNAAERQDKRQLRTLGLLRELDKTPLAAEVRDRLDRIEAMLTEEEPSNG